MHLDSTFQLHGKPVTDLHGLLASTLNDFFLGYKELEGKQGPNSQEAFLLSSV